MANVQKYAASSTVAGKSYSFSTDVSSDSVLQSEVTLAGAKTGQLTTRTDEDSGVITMDGGHGIVTSDHVDIYWDGGSRRNCEASVTVNALTVNNDGAGDNLPDNLTDVTVMVRHEEDFNIPDTDNIVAINMYAPVSANISLVYYDGETEAEVFNRQITSSMLGFIYLADGGLDSPLDGSVINRLYFSHGSTSSQTLRCALQYN